MLDGTAKGTALPVIDQPRNVLNWLMLCGLSVAIAAAAAQADSVNGWLIMNADDWASGRAPKPWCSAATLKNYFDTVVLRSKYLHYRFQVPKCVRTLTPVPGEVITSELGKPVTVLDPVSG